MKKFFAITVSSLALAMSAPTAAQDANGTTKAAEAEATAIAPARLEAAQNAVDYLFPLGTYERMMKGTMDQMMDQMMKSMGDMRMGDLAGAGGVARGDMPDGMGEKTLAEMATEMDPHYEERTQISTKIIMDEMVDLMITMEPAVRAALTNIYARKFTVAQLTEMNDFFATDTGSAFARDYMMVFVDPEMMQSMMSMVPELMQAMPDIMKKVEEATAHLPPVEITGANNPFAPVEEVVKDVDNADDSSKYYDPETWSAEDRAAVAKAEADLDAKYSAYEATSDSVTAATEKAMKNAKIRSERNK